MTKIRSLTAAVFMAATMGNTFTSTTAQASSQPFLGELMLTGYTFCPRGWANADGQLLAISSNSALFSLYGTQFGGDGRTTFGLPDLRNRSSVHVGNGPGIGDSGRVGAKSGTTSFIMNQNQMPSHTHRLRGHEEDPNSEEPNNAVMAKSGSNIYSTGAADTDMSASAIGTAGGNQPVNKRSPFLVLRWCVATQGVYPSRN